MDRSLCRAGRSGAGTAAPPYPGADPRGNHLLDLLAEHAGIEAKIEAPSDWVDPVMDRPEAPRERVETA
jgi:hypothetical protein